MAKENKCPQCGAATESKMVEGRPRKVLICTECGYIVTNATEKPKDE